MNEWSILVVPKETAGMVATSRERSLSMRPVRNTQKSAVPVPSFTVYVLFSNPISTTAFKSEQSLTLCTYSVFTICEY